MVIDDVEEQAIQLSNVEQNVDTMQATMERVEAMMMHMAQSLQAQSLQQPIQKQQKQQVRHEEWRSSYVNEVLISKENNTCRVQYQGAPGETRQERATNCSLIADR